MRGGDAQRNSKRLPFHETQRKRNIPNRLRERRHPQFPPSPRLRRLSDSRGKVCVEKCAVYQHHLL